MPAQIYLIVWIDLELQTLSRTPSTRSSSLSRGPTVTIENGNYVFLSRETRKPTLSLMLIVEGTSTYMPL